MRQIDGMGGHAAHEKGYDLCRSDCLFPPQVLCLEITFPTDDAKDARSTHNWIDGFAPSQGGGIKGARQGDAREERLHPVATRGVPLDPPAAREADAEG